MSHLETTAMGAALAISLYVPAFAETATTAAPIDCGAEFSTMDLDSNGTLSESEAPRAYAHSRIYGVVLHDSGLTKDAYMALCASPDWPVKTPDAGAPLAGANSFTENQARDRAVEWNITDVSALTLDDKGVWRGTGKVAGAAVSVAIDYKGNVVTSAVQP